MNDLLDCSPVASDFHLLDHMFHLLHQMFHLLQYHFYQDKQQINPATPTHHTHTKNINCDQKSPTNSNQQYDNKKKKCQKLGFYSIHISIPKPKKIGIKGHYLTVTILITEAVPTRCRATTESPSLHNPFVLAC